MKRFGITILKYIAKIILSMIVLIICHYLFGDINMEFEGIWSYIGKIIVCIVAYGIHRFVEWAAEKILPAQPDEAQSKLHVLIESLDKNQVLCYIEKKKDPAYYILTLDESVFELAPKPEDRDVSDLAVFEIKGKRKCEILLHLSEYDSEEKAINTNKKSLPKNDRSKMYEINTAAGKVKVQTSDYMEKEKGYVTIFLYKVKDGLYFEGDFFLKEDWELDAEKIVAGVFQKVECCLEE